MVENKVDLGEFITVENWKAEADAEGEVLFLPALLSGLQKRRHGPME